MAEWTFKSEESNKKKIKEDEKIRDAHTRAREPLILAVICPHCRNKLTTVSVHLLLSKSL